MYKRQKGFLGLGVLFLIALVVLGGSTIYVLKQKVDSLKSNNERLVEQQTVQEETETPSQTEPSPIPDPVITIPAYEPEPTPIPSPIAPTETPEIDIPEPKIITKTVVVPNYVDESRILEAEEKARKAAECQRLTDVYTSCMEDFNDRMSDYSACQERSNDTMQNYNDEMQNYSNCVNDYNKDLDSYNDCVDLYTRIGERSDIACRKPFSNSCRKPTTVYPGSCLKPNNWCTKPYCY